MKNTKVLLRSNILRLRNTTNLTQAELAEKADLSVKMIQKVEYGSVSPSTETLDKLANALNVDVDDLFNDGRLTEKSITKPIAASVDFLSKFSLLSPFWQRIVLACVYKDASYLDGFHVTQEHRSEFYKLFGQLLKQHR